MITIDTPNKQKVKMVAVLIFGAFIMMLTETFFNNALPTIINQYSVSQSIAQWVSTGYQLVTGLMIPLSAWFFHRFNTKHTFISLLLIFLLGSACGFLASNFWLLLLGRLIQAIAAGAMIPLIQNVVLVLYPQEKRGFIMGIIGLVIAFGPALGPTVGGWIIDNLGLKWLFGILIPLTIILLVISLFNAKNVNKIDRTQRVDWLSVVESCLGFGALLYGFSDIGNMGTINFTNGFITIMGLVVLVFFCWRQLKLEKPLVNLSVFRNYTFNLTTILSAISNIALLSVELVLPLYLQRVHGLSAFQAGLMLLPGAILEGITSPIAGRLYDKFGIKKLSLIGYAIIILGTMPMMFFTPETNLLLVAGAYAFRIIGIATVMMPTFTEGLNALPIDLYVHGNAAASTARQIAGSLGTAVLMMIIAFGSKHVAGNNLLQAEQLNYGYRYAFLASFIFALIGFVLSFWLKSKQQ